jgi:hypothetical protein
VAATGRHPGAYFEQVFYTEKMTSAVQQLLSLRDAGDRYDTPPSDLLPMQLQAVQERFDSQVDRIPLLKNRAESGGVARIVSQKDLVPLLFAHNTYKSYSEPWLIEGQWNRMAKWLATVSTYELEDTDFEDVKGLDEWVIRLEDQGRFLGTTSGTTGKPALLGAVDADLSFSSLANVSSFVWATDIPAAQDRKFLGLGPRTTSARNERVRLALINAFCSPTEEPYQLPVPPISTESVMAMIMLRRKIADGLAQPSEVAEFESLAAQRLSAMEAAQADAVDALIESRRSKLFIGTMLAGAYELAIAVKARGVSGADFTEENALFTGGGLKGAQLPPDFRQTIYETFNIDERHAYQLYSMQELNTDFPRCTAGRYHTAPWVVALPLDESGEHLLDTDDGEVEARAAFLDLALEGRWGGVITGDRVTIDFGRCACGRQGPHIGPDIMRYADLESGDKISCAGTIDAYVRGAS